MTKKKQAGDAVDNPAAGDGGQEKPKRQRANASIGNMFASFIPELKEYAEEKYREVRFNKDASDEELASRDKLRKAIAQLGGSTTP